MKIKIYSMLLSVAMALAVVTFGSCSNDEIMEVKQESCSLGDEILFHSDVLSRAVATTTGSINKIWVYAYTKNTANGNQAKEVIPGVEFTKGEDNTFISEKKYYWPENDEVCFIALYPTPSELGIADDKILESMPEQVRTGVDDLYSYLVKNAENTILGNIYAKTGSGFSSSNFYAKDIVVATANGTKKDNEKNGINLAFKHILSQVEIKAKYTGDKYEVKCGSVSLNSIDCVGDFNLKTFEVENTQKFTSFQTTYIPYFTAPITLAKEANVLSNNANKQHSANLIVIPQNNTEWSVATDPSNNSGGALITLNLQITENGNSLLDTSNWSEDRKKISAPNDGFISVGIPVTAQWEEGKKYSYTIEFSDEGLGYYIPQDPERPGEPILGQAIKFINVEVKDWENNEGQTINPK